jgi:murein DD-endopeptidase MepM/ murein hydrolase activator NlpD
MRALRPTAYLVLAGLGLCASLAPAASPAAETAGTTTTETQTVPLEATPPSSGSEARSTTSTPQTVQEGSGRKPAVTAPLVKSGHAQHSTATPPPHAGQKGKGEEAGARKPATPSSKAGGKAAPLPSTLTPPLPLSLGGSVFGIPNFFVESFRVPPFLLPIYQAAGAAYDVPWQVLAAINEVETDYGRDLGVSSAGAEGWMQFLPAEWAIYGVDANGDGYRDPYNPADAIFAAARYLRAAGAATDISGAVFAYNHSRGYVESVLLRAKLLGGTPSELLGAITGLTQSRFPVHAPSHFSDGFPSVQRDGRSVTIPATTIYSEDGAPVIAVQDGKVVQIGASPLLGRFLALRDAYGNTYYYAHLGSIAHLYPVLVPRWLARVSPSPATPVSAEPRPTGPASAGTQHAQPASGGGVESAGLPALSLGVGAGIEPSAPAAAKAAPSAAGAGAAAPVRSTAAPRSFRAGVYEVYLHALRPGVSVIAGTVLGHVGGATAPAGGAALAAGAGADEPHIIFQIRPAGAGAPLIDPKPVLDGWVALENTSIFRAKGKRPFARLSPSPGQALLESKEQLRRQVLSNRDIDVYACGRADIESGLIDRRVLATLEFLAVSGLRPTVSALKCAHPALPAGADRSAHASGDAVAISAVNGRALAAGHGRGSDVGRAVARLRMLQGQMRPHIAVHATAIDVAFPPLGAPRARAAGALSASVSPGEWTRLIARLGEIPNPTVSSHPSAAAIPDQRPQSAGGAHGNG